MISVKFLHHEGAKPTAAYSYMFNQIKTLVLLSLLVYP